MKCCKIQGRKEYTYSADSKMEKGLAAPNVVLVESKHRYLKYINRKQTQPTLLTSQRIYGYIILRGYIENHTRKTLVTEGMRVETSTLHRVKKRIRKVTPEFLIMWNVRLSIYGILEESTRATLVRPCY
jgi:hypothetical protein